MQTTDTIPQQPKHKRSVALTVILIIVAVLALAAIGICWFLYQKAPGFLSSQEATIAGWIGTTTPGISCDEVADEFMNALKSGNYQAGYDMCYLTLKTKIGTVTDLKNMIEEADIQPQEWNLINWSTYTDENEITISKAEGSFTYQDGRQGAVTLDLVPEGADCKVLGFSLYFDN